MSYYDDLLRHVVSRPETMGEVENLPLEPVEEDPESIPIAEGGLPDEFAVVRGHDRFLFMGGVPREPRAGS